MYATQQDIEERYGADKLLVIADRDHDGEVDADAVARALSDAGDEINAHCVVRYPQLPNLAAEDRPPILVRLAVDIAIYRLASEAGVLTEDIQARYKGARDDLVGISKGTISLGLAGAPVKTTGGGASVESNQRVFKRGQKVF